MNSASQKYYKLVTREDEEIMSKKSNPEVVTIENIKSPEIQKRMKFDKEVKNQVIKLRVQHLEDPVIRKFMVLLLLRQPSLMEAFRKPHKLIEL